MAYLTADRRNSTLSYSSLAGSPASSESPVVLRPAVADGLP